MTAANRHDWIARAEARAEYKAANRAEYDRVRAEALAKVHAENREQRAHKGAIRRAARLMDKAKPTPAASPLDERLMTDAELATLGKALLDADKYDWPATARPEQRQPEDYQTFLFLGGRGLGKTRLATEAIREWCSIPNQRIAIVAQDHKALRDVNFDGISGLLSCVPPGDLKPGSYKRGLGDVSVEFANGSIVFGFGLALDTPIPTPSGWTKMGDLHGGDFVFDEAGRPCRVMSAWPEYEPERMYRLTFSDGSELEADGDHLWTTWAHLDKENLMRLTGATEFPVDWPAFRGPLRAAYRGICGSYGPAVRTTDQIAATLTHPHATRVLRNHHIPLAGALELPEVDLPLDPWVLGYWLGNGEMKQARLACDPKDRPEIFQHLAEFEPHGNPAYPVRIDTRGLRKHLGAIGVLFDKHVPPAYLRASLDQRLALLQGLMDSDGHASARGNDVMFSNTNRNLVDAVFELVLSLGERPGTSQTFASTTSYGNLDGWKISWTPRNQVPFRLARKAERVSFSGTLKTRYRSVVSCEPIEPRPVRCITVASPNQMYLAGETFIPTHNTAEAPDSVRGRSFDAAVADEYAVWSRNKAQDMLDQLRLCLRDSSNPRIIITTTPKRVPHIVDLVKRAEAGEEGLVVRRGKTSDNTKLSKVARDMLYRMYGGTRIGRQELEGILLTDVDNALWTADMVEGARWTSDEDFPPMVGVITGVDPSGSETGDATGIVTCGWDKNKVIYVLENRSTQGTPAHRYSEVCRSARRWGAGQIWSESAFSGDSSIYGIGQQWKNLVDSGEFPDGSVCPAIKPSTIKGDKAARAMSIVALYEQQLITGKMRIVHPVHTEGNGIAALEEEQLSWDTSSKKSPNAIDAMVHAARQIRRRTGDESVISSPARSMRRIGRRVYKPWEDTS
jgi:phage terminase large subunit-like protein